MQPPICNTTSARFPKEAELAALRGWYAGMKARDAVARYLQPARQDVSAPRTLGHLRKRLAAYAYARDRPDLASVFLAPPTRNDSTAVSRAIETLRWLPLPSPVMTDPVGQWFSSRIATALSNNGLPTLADVCVRVRRRRRWWEAVQGLGAAGARQVEALIAAATELARRTETVQGMNSPELVPWERLLVPADLDGARGQFRAPAHTCLLDAASDYEAVQSWLSLHDSGGTRRAYRKEAERLMLWAIVERHRALSSLTTDDATAYRAFLRRPVPAARWSGPARPRHSPEWRPFVAALSPRSTAYTLAVLASMYRWLVEQHYVFANPFSGLRVGSRIRAGGFDAGHSFSQGEWRLIRPVADTLESIHGWQAPAAQRLRFVLDFGYATGLRAGELVNAKLGDVRTDEHGDHWLRVLGKGERDGKVGLPPLARVALTRYLRERGLPLIPERWKPATPILASLDDNTETIASLRLWRILRRFFLTAADALESGRPALADKLRCASPHWLRHTHASHALARGAELVTVRDNLRHSSIATTSLYLHGDEARRAHQLDQAFRD